MSLKSFPAAHAAIVAITALTLSLPAVQALGDTQAAARKETRPAAARQEASLWQWVLDLFLPDHGQPPPAHGNSGCEMDPDGVVHNPPMPKPCV